MSNERWVDATELGSPFEVQIDLNSSRKRWRALGGSDADWTDGDPPPYK